MAAPRKIIAPAATFAALATLAVFAPLAAHAKPQLPVKLELTFESPSAPDQSASFIVKVSTSVDLPAAKLALVLPEQVQLAEGEPPARNFAAVAGDEITFRFAATVDLPPKPANTGIEPRDVVAYEVAVRLAARPRPAQEQNAILHMRTVLHLGIVDDLIAGSNVSAAAARRKALLDFYRRVLSSAEHADIDEESLPDDFRRTLAAIDETRVGSGKSNRPRKLVNTHHEQKADEETQQ